jgi:hypothetical protein
MRIGSRRRGILVVPSEEKNLTVSHPSGLRLKFERSVEWPNDNFTRRKIRDGTIKTVENVAGRKDK